MLAIGVGGADAVDAMTGTPWELKAPQVVGKQTREVSDTGMFERSVLRHTSHRTIKWVGNN